MARFLGSGSWWGFWLVCGCGMDGSLGVVVVAGEVAGVAAVLLLFLLLVRLRAAALVVCGRGREGVGLLLGAFVVVWCALGLCVWCGGALCFRC